MDKKHKMKFVVVSGRPITGGEIALHALCKYLSDAGYNAKILKSFRPYGYKAYHAYQNNLLSRLKLKLIYPLKYAADIARLLIAEASEFFGIGGNILRKLGMFRGYFDVAVKGCKRKWLPFVDDDTVVVYPEVMYGNFLKAKNVVRWLLYFKKSDNTYGENDLVFSYSEKINNPELNPQCRVCAVRYFNWELYKRTNFGERHGTCYIVRKGGKRPDLPKNFDGVVIDNLLELDKVAQFNKCKYCVSYDLYTAYSSIAAMLGCISIIVPEPGKTRQDYEQTPRYGVAFGFDEEEINFAQSTLDKLAEDFRTIEQQNRENVKYFIEECRKYFHMN